MKTIDGERSKGDLVIAARTNRLPVIDIIIRSATIQQLIMTVFSTLKAWLPLPLELLLV